MNILKLAMLFSFGFQLFSCKKEGTPVVNAATIVVVNTAVNVPAIKVKIAVPTIIWTDPTIPAVNYGAAKLYAAPVGNPQFTVVSSADTTHPILQNNFKIQSAIYTMYIAGQEPNIDTLFREEKNYPYIRTDIAIPPSSDSVVQLRFVNLSPNSTPVKIKLVGAVTNEVESLPYKGISDFKSYPARLTSTAYSFQIRDAVTDILITTFTFNATATNRFRNVALVIKGLRGTTNGTNSFGMFPVNYL